MISTIKTAIKFFNEQGIHSLNNIPPIKALTKNKKLHQKVFLFTVDDVWEKTSISNLRKLVRILDEYEVKCTFFITPYYHYDELSAEKAEKLKGILKSHEIAMHGIRHNRDLMRISPKEGIYELRHCKRFLEKRFNRRIYGYRSPDFLRDRRLLKELVRSGFLYNSDQFLFRPYPFMLDKMAILPIHDRCDPFALESDESEILELIGERLACSEASGKPYIFLMHPYDLDEKNMSILIKIFEKVKSRGFVTNLTLGDIAEKLAKRDV